MRLGTAPIAVLMTALFGLSASVADPLGDLLSSSGGGACFERVYDKAHLARVAGQDTRRALLSLVSNTKAGGATMRIVIEGRKRTSVIVGECGWSAHANLDIRDKPLLRSFKGGPGLDCHAYSSIDGSSAEEGGDFVIDIRSAGAAVIHLPDSIAAWPAIERHGNAKWVEFGENDRVFKLEKTDRNLCKRIEASIPPMR